MVGKSGVKSEHISKKKKQSMFLAEPSMVKSRASVRLQKKNQDKANGLGLNQSLEREGEHSFSYSPDLPGPPNL